MRMFLATVIVSVFALGSCAGINRTPLTADQQLAVVELAFTEVVDQLTMARTTGVIAALDVWRCSQTITGIIDRAIDAAHRMLTSNRSIAVILGTVQAHLRQLRLIHSTGENVCVDNSINSSHFRHPPLQPSIGYRI